MQATLNGKPCSVRKRLTTETLRAFTLVEVVLAIGVVSFALVGLMGLIPAGLTTFRQSIDTSLHAQIVQRIAGEAQLTDFVSLTASQAPLRYFDDQGAEVAAGDAHLYCVRTTVSANTALPTQASTDSLATLVIDIAKDAGDSADPFTAAKSDAYKTYSTLIAR